MPYSCDEGDDGRKGDQSPPVEEVASLKGAPRSSAFSIDPASRRTLIALLVLLTVASFLTSLSGEFILDDLPQIVTNNSFGHWDGETMKRLLTRDFWASLRPELARDNLDSVYYRPVFSLFLMLGYEVAGRQSLRWHLLVVLLHCIAVAAVFLVGEGLLQAIRGLSPKKRRLMAAFAAGVFAVHPVQAESVAWISGSVGPLSAIFLLGASYFYLVHRERGRPASLMLALLLFALALLAKESALVLLLIVCAYEFLISPVSSRSNRSAVLRLIPFGLTAAGYFALRYGVLKVLLGRSMNANFPDDASLTLADMLRTLPLLIASYARLIVFPSGLSLEYDVGYVSSLGLTTFWLPLAIVVGLGVSLWQCWRRIPESRVAIIWIVLPLLPHLSIRSFVSEEIIHDRYLYLTMFGVGLLAATLIGRMRLPDRALVAAAVGLLLLFGATIAIHNLNWMNENEVWSHSARYAPNSRLVHTALGVMAERRRDFEDALREYDRALAISPDCIDPLNNSALLNARLGRWGEAIPKFERIVLLTPGKAMAHFNLSFAYAVEKRLNAAAHELRAAIALDPHGPREDEWRARLDQLEKAIAAQGGIESGAS